MLRWSIIFFVARGIGVIIGDACRLLSRSSHEQTAYKASCVQLLPLLPQKRPQRLVSSEYSMRISFGDGGPARGQAGPREPPTHQRRGPAHWRRAQVIWQRVPCRAVPVGWAQACLLLLLVWTAAVGRGGAARAALRLFESGDHRMAASLGQVVDRLPRAARRVEASPAHKPQDLACQPKCTFNLSCSCASCSSKWLAPTGGARLAPASPLTRGSGRDDGGMAQMDSVGRKP